MSKRLNPLELAKSLILAKTGQLPVGENDGKPFPCIPSGSMTLDMAIGGTPLKTGGFKCPGYPRRRVVEIFGPWSSGKTTLALAAIAQVQKAGGCALFLDFEHALDDSYAKAVGVSYEETKFLKYSPLCMEDGFKDIYLAIAAGVDLIVVDSAAAMIPKDELDRKLDEGARLGIVSKRFAENLPKICGWLEDPPAVNGAKVPKDHQGTNVIFLNQERANISTGPAGYGELEPNTPGGNAMKHYTTLRIRLKKKSSDRIEVVDRVTGIKKTQPFGNTVTVKVLKNKIDMKQGYQTEIFIRYGYGVDDWYSLISAGLSMKVFKKTGTTFSYGDAVRVVGKDKFRKALIQNTAAADEARKKILDLLRESSGAVADSEITDDASIVDDSVDDDENVTGEEIADILETTGD
jgi:recombination protein RecA